MSASLVSCFELMKFLRSSSSPSDNLFLQNADKIKESLSYVDKVNLYCFFGRFVGFQVNIIFHRKEEICLTELIKYKTC